MAEVAKPPIVGLIPLAHSADLQCTVDFYKYLGMEVQGTLRNPAGGLQWVHLSSGRADLMFSQASKPVIAGQQAVLFYLYASNLVALREDLLARNITVSDIAYPEYMRKGEVRVEDPDGYVLLIGQAD